MRRLLFLLVPAALQGQMITPNPCHLLTADEVLAVTHDTVAKMSLQQFQEPECDISTTGGTPDAPGAMVKIKIETTRDYSDLWWDEYDTNKTPIPNLGERAVFSGTPPVAKILHRNHVYTISYDNPALQADAIKEREKALAFFAIARAP
jgi:hypothetical protein